MEENKLVNLAINSMWYTIREEVEFFSNKIALTFLVYSEILENTLRKSAPSKLAKKVLFQNIILYPFISAQEGIDMAIKYNTEDAGMVFDNNRLNLRGMARLRILKGIANNQVYDKKKNNDIHYAVSSALQQFDLSSTSFKEKSFFEILVDFIEPRTHLHAGDEKMVANTLINNDDYSPVVNCLNDSFEDYIAKLFLDFEHELKKQGADRSNAEIALNIYRELSKHFKRHDFLSKTIVTSDFVQEIINNYIE